MVPADCILDSIKKVDYEPQGKLHLWLPSTGLWASLVHHMPSPHFPPLCSKLLVLTSKGGSERKL